jgi:hypothetical protein
MEPGCQKDALMHNKALWHDFGVLTTIASSGMVYNYPPALIGAAKSWYVWQENVRRQFWNVAIQEIHQNSIHSCIVSFLWSWQRDDCKPKFSLSMFKQVYGLKINFIRVRFMIWGCKRARRRLCSTFWFGVGSFKI